MPRALVMKKEAIQSVVWKFQFSEFYWAIGCLD
jgi:hypothetical protein